MCVVIDMKAAFISAINVECDIKHEEDLQCVVKLQLYIFYNASEPDCELCQRSCISLGGRLQ